LRQRSLTGIAVGFGREGPETQWARRPRRSRLDTKVAELAAEFGGVANITALERTLLE
jgi:hypothetical protein